MKIELAIKKLRKVGGSVFVSIPPSWLKKNTLGDGDEVKISEHSDGTLIIEKVR